MSEAEWAALEPLLLATARDAGEVQKFASRRLLLRQVRGSARGRRLTSPALIPCRTAIGARVPRARFRP